MEPDCLFICFSVNLLIEDGISVCSIGKFVEHLSTWIVMWKNSIWYSNRKITILSKERACNEMEWFNIVWFPEEMNQVKKARLNHKMSSLLDQFCLVTRNHVQSLVNSTSNFNKSQFSPYLGNSQQIHRCFLLGFRYLRFGVWSRQAASVCLGHMATASWRLVLQRALPHVRRLWMEAGESKVRFDCGALFLRTKKPVITKTMDGWNNAVFSPTA